MPREVERLEPFYLGGWVGTLLGKTSLKSLRNENRSFVAFSSCLLVSGYLYANALLKVGTVFLVSYLGKWIGKY